MFCPKLTGCSPPEPATCSVSSAQFLRDSCALRRNMQDLWDEEYTDLCRENFINAMYKFPDTPVTALENGREMPILGVGTWLKQNVQETVEQALRAGFR